MHDDPSLLALRRKIADKKAALAEPVPDKAPKVRSIAMRMATDLMACVIAGCIAGYIIDHFLGSFPAFVSVFCILGVVSGFVTMYRTNNRFLDQEDHGEKKESLEGE